jgi:alpha-D-ribose 1-methylphosphonate 5-triphosphate synthase subunit PhnL
MTALSITGLRKRFVRHLHGGAVLDVLRGVDLALEPGTCTVLRGPSGSGKSSVLRCVFRSYRPDAGQAVVDGDGPALDLASADERTVLRARRERLALATQFLHATPRVAAVDLVAEAGVDRAAAAELLRSLGLSAALVATPPATFSGGERQIVNLAIALARPRPLLLLDEVTASLDRERRHLALAALDDRKQAGTTMLAIFHDLPEAGGLVDRVVTMRDGRVTA